MFCWRFPRPSSHLLQIMSASRSVNQPSIAERRSPKKLTRWRSTQHIYAVLTVLLTLLISHCLITPQGFLLSPALSADSDSFCGLWDMGGDFLIKTRVKQSVCMWLFGASEKCIDWISKIDVGLLQLATHVGRRRARPYNSRFFCLAPSSSITWEEFEMFLPLASIFCQIVCFCCLWVDWTDSADLLFSLLSQLKSSTPVYQDICKLCGLTYTPFYSV